jgi:hypothetical protein
VTKQAIQITQWWQDNRKNDKSKRVEQRDVHHQERAANARHSNRGGRCVTRKQIVDIEEVNWDAENGSWVSRGCQLA